MADPFDALPDRPAARAIDPSPFTPEPGARPPDLVGREHHTGIAVETLARLLELRAAPPVTFEGVAGVGTTTLLRTTADALVERGGVVLWITDHGDTRTTAADDLRLAAETPASYTTATPTLIGIDANDGPAMPGTDGAVDAVLELVERGQRPVLVAIDQAQQASTDTLELLDRLQQPWLDDRAIGVALAGAPGARTRLGRRRELLETTRHVAVDRLTVTDARQLLTAPLQRAGVDVPGRWIDRAVQRSEGLPAALQRWGEQTWRAIKTDTAHDPAALQAADKQLQYPLDQGRYAALWAATTPMGRRWLQALATVGEGDPARVSEVAAAAGDTDLNRWAWVRDQALRAGVVTAPERGWIGLAVPGMQQWLQRQGAAAMPDLPLGRPPPQRLSPTAAISQEQQAAQTRAR